MTNEEFLWNWDKQWLKVLTMLKAYSLPSKHSKQECGLDN
jgi:hypothetical protein